MWRKSQVTKLFSHCSCGFNETCNELPYNFKRLHISVAKAKLPMCIGSILRHNYPAYKYKSNITLINRLTHSISLRHTHTHAGVDGVLYHRRASGVSGLSKCCSGGPAESRHTARKDIAVSLSSISSVAVASILDREKSLTDRPSTIFQDLS